MEEPLFLEHTLAELDQRSRENRRYEYGAALAIAVLTAFAYLALTVRLGLQAAVRLDFEMASSLLDIRLLNFRTDSTIWHEIERSVYSTTRWRF